MALSFILSAISLARKAAQGALDLFRRYPLQVALILAVGLSVWLWTGKRGAIAERDAAIAGRATDRAAYTEAQRQAAILARQAREAQEARYRAAAERKDVEYAENLQGALARTRAYADSHRLRATGTAASPARDPGSTTPDHGAEGGVGPGRNSDLVAVTPDDLRICTVNTERIKAVREWALGLNP